MFLLLVLTLVVPVAPVARPAGGVPASPRVPLAPASVGGVGPLAATLSLGLTVSTPQANPKDTVSFTVSFNNTGTQTAPAAWINVTAASGFTFERDTATGNASGFPDYEFLNVALGLHSFRMDLAVDVGVAPGTRLSVSATLVYSDGSGGQRFLGPAAASVLVGVVTKSLYLAPATLTSGALTPVPPTGSLTAAGTYTLTQGGPAVNFDLTPVLAGSFRALNATAVLYLRPLTPPATLVVNLTLIDVNGASTTPVATVQQPFTVTGTGYWTLYYAFPALNVRFSAGHQIRLQVLNTLASGESAQLATNATAQPSQVSFQTTTYVSINSLQPAISPTTYLSPKSSLVVTANVSEPFGSSEILAAHVNVTGPSGSLTNWSTAFPVVATDPSVPSAWKLFRLSLPPTLALGPYAIEATAVERNSVTDVADGAAIVRAPVLHVTKLASPNQGKSGTKITYTIWYNNTGTGPSGRLWINDTLPSQVTYLSSSPTGSLVGGSTYAWSFPSLGAGASAAIQISAQVKGGLSGVAYIRNWVWLNYSDPQGFLWPALPSHADVVLNGPFLTVSQTSTPAAYLHANQTVRYAVNLTNTGDAAQTVWVNDTLPAGLSYVSDTSGVTPTFTGNTIRWVFPGMASGLASPTALNFLLTARAASGLAWGLSLPNVVGVNDTSTNGLLMPDLLRVLTLTSASPALSAASVSFGVPTAVPSVPLLLTVNFTNVGNEPAPLVWVNLTLDPSLQFLGPSGNATVLGSRVSLRLSDVAVGASSVGLSVAAATSVVDRQVLRISGTLAATDGYGNVLAPVALTAAAVPVALPDVTFRVSPGETSAEAGTSVAFILTGGNSGSGTASVLWLNLTLPAGLRYVNDTFGSAPTVLGSLYSWEWRDYAPGTRIYRLGLEVAPSAPDGSVANVSFSARAVDAGGNLRPIASAAGAVVVRAPAFDLRVWADANATLPGRRFTYTLLATNAGSTMAQTLWITDSVDSRLSLVYYNATTAATGTTTLNWTFQDVQPGQTVVITLDVQVANGVPGNTEIVNTFQVAYTNSGGLYLASAQSAPSTVTVQADLLPLLLILAVGSALGAAAVFVVYRRYRVQIEDVFLVYRDGILVSHLARGDGTEKDEDLLSGMLTAVQDFVKDAFTYGEHRELHQLEFGDYHVLIERGKLVYLAVVYQGRDSGLIRKRVRTVLDRVESAYGEVFEGWDGDVAQVEGTGDLLRQGFVEDKRPWSLVRSKPV